MVDGIDDGVRDNGMNDGRGEQRTARLLRGRGTLTAATTLFGQRTGGGRRCGGVA